MNGESPVVIGMQHNNFFQIFENSELIQKTSYGEIKVYYPSYGKQPNIKAPFMYIKYSAYRPIYLRSQIKMTLVELSRTPPNGITFVSGTNFNPIDEKTKLENHTHAKLVNPTTDVENLSFGNCTNNVLLLKLGDFVDETVSSFLIAVNRADGVGLTGFFTINCNSLYNINNQKLNGIHSNYSIYEIESGKLLRLYKNIEDKTTAVYIACPSHGTVQVLLLKNKAKVWSNKADNDITLTTVSEVSGTLVDSI